MKNGRILFWGKQVGKKNWRKLNILQV